MVVSYIPKELLNKILEYDGRIKYKNGKYINVIHKNDERYNIIKPIINKKLLILKTAKKSNDDFYFTFEFDAIKKGLCYFLHFDIFEICYYDFKNGYYKVIRTCFK